MLNLLLGSTHQQLQLRCRNEIATLLFAGIRSAQYANYLALLIDTWTTAMAPYGHAVHHNLFAGFKALPVRRRVSVMMEFHANIPFREVHVAIQMHSRSKQAFASLVIANDAHSLFELTLVLQLQRWEILAAHQFLVIQQQNFGLITTSHAISIDIILHASGNAKDTGINVTLAAIKARVFRHNLSEVSEHRNFSSLTSSVLREDANNNFSAAQAIVVGSKRVFIVASTIL